MEEGWQLAVDGIWFMARITATFPASHFMYYVSRIPSQR